MKLLTKEILSLAKKHGNQDQVEKFGDTIVITKYFHPCSTWVWYATRYDPRTRTFFGYVCGFAEESGPFSLDQLESIRIFELAVERDKLFKPTTLAAALKRDGRPVPEWMTK